MADALYTTEAALALKLGQVGVDLRSDDDPTALADVIDEASATVDGHLLSKYTAAALAANREVGHACRAIACMYLCERRGEPPPASVENAYKRYLEWLKAVAAGTVVLPGAARVASGPIVSNQRVALDRYPSLVVLRPQSTRPAQASPRRTDPDADAIQR